MPTRYERQYKEYKECRALYDADKDAECFQLGEYNLTDPGMSVYLRFKSYCLVAASAAAAAAAAADDWRKAEVS
jgi:hypothetical protein